jgi:hypothetical protein
MPDSKITIRLPETLAAKLSEVADRHSVTRTAILLDLLASGIDQWEPAQLRTSPSDVARLDGAIEVLRLELDEAIERIDRLERQANVQRRPTRKTVPQPSPHPGEFLSQIKLLARLGWPKSSTHRRAKKLGLSINELIEKETRWRLRDDGLWGVTGDITRENSP